MEFLQLKFVLCLICFLLWSTVMTEALRIGPVSTKILDHGTAGMMRRKGALGLRSDLGLGSFQSTLSSSRLLSSTSSTNNASGRYDELAYRLQSYLGGIYAVSPLNILTIRLRTSHRTTLLYIFRFPYVYTLVFLCAYGRRN